MFKNYYYISDVNLHKAPQLMMVMIMMMMITGIVASCINPINNINYFYINTII